MYNITQRGLFPTDVYHLDIYDEKENKKYKDFLIDLASKDEGKKRSNRGGYQSDTLLWQEKIFEPLLEKFGGVVNFLLEKLTDTDRNKPEAVIRAMWANVNPKGGYNFTHVHPGSWMSGVYYVDVPNNDSPLSFEDPRPARMMDFQRSAIIKDEYYMHQPEMGQLVLFPSWLPHFVNPNTSDQLRISMSFNVELLV